MLILPFYGMGNRAQRHLLIFPQGMDFDWSVNTREFNYYLEMKFLAKYFWKAKRIVVFGKEEI